ncbi:hypothetical protein BT63DRAFT_417282 [Microthyrium microscopicum]|uniref:DUF1168-domain-containing protein n=1 Tax=Microthyrium microscopicum TaxID=703497 RepID=A0A6A6U2V8_9PEZI|nr:hypothetical protein BT63DRAFT_417282 [Microthyrium microscopicum]
MSEPGPESIPTSISSQSNRPLKKRALTPVSHHASQVDALFARPDRPVALPTTSSKSLALPPEIVTNVAGSSAGAGSGEFHVYKASRRRELERVRGMEEETKKEVEDAEWEKEQEERRKRDEAKTGRNKKRREKKKNNGKKGGKEEEKSGVKLTVPSNKRAVQSATPEVERDAGVGVVEEVGIIIHDDD